MAHLSDSSAFGSNYRSTDRIVDRLQDLENRVDRLWEVVNPPCSQCGHQATNPTNPSFFGAR